MAATRYHAIYLSDERDRGLRPNAVFFHVDGIDEIEKDANALAAAQAIEGLINGKIGSLLKQIYVISEAEKASLPEGFDADGINGKADNCRVLFRSASGFLEQISWRYHQHSKTNLDVEAALEGLGLKNRNGEDIGSIVRVNISPMKPE